MDTATKIALVIGALSLLIVVTGKIGVPAWNEWKHPSEALHDQLDSLQAQLDRSRLIRAEQDSIIAANWIAIEASLASSKQSKQRLDEIRKRNEQIISDISNPTPTKLDSFFSARYGQ